jgi:hypothetical protein
VHGYCGRAHPWISMTPIWWIIHINVLCTLEEHHPMILGEPSHPISLPETAASVLFPWLVWWIGDLRSSDDRLLMYCAE